MSLRIRVDPGPCPICDAPHTSCVGEGDTSSRGVGTTHGVIVRGFTGSRSVSIVERAVPFAATRAAPPQPPPGTRATLDAIASPDPRCGKVTVERLEPEAPAAPATRKGRR